MENLYEKKIRDLNDEEWNALCADLLSCQPLLEVSFWTEKNNSLPSDEKAFVEKSKKNIPLIVPKLLQLCK